MSVRRDKKSERKIKRIIREDGLTFSSLEDEMREIQMEININQKKVESFKEEQGRTQETAATLQKIQRLKKKVERIMKAKTIFFLCVKFFYHSYQETLKTLESYLLFKIPKENRPLDVRQVRNIDAMLDYVDRLNIVLTQIPSIHIAGTKGKGSTSSYVERILREKGYKTGLFTSPHLIDVRERIRINGELISKDQFVDTFWEIFYTLDKTRSDMFPSMATFFRILTLIAFKVFIKEKVDVGIFEVGLGGRLDATNIIHPVVCGITHIGLDHTKILGDTVEKIAFEKAGIIKPGVPVVTYKQKDSILDVFRESAKKNNTKLIIAPEYDNIFNTEDLKSKVEINLRGEHQKINSAVAIKICEVFESEISGKSITSCVTDEIIHGLNDCKIAGRGHVLKFEDKSLNFFLDGAHTSESLQYCKKWFEFAHQNHKNYDSHIISNEVAPFKKGILKMLDGIKPTKFNMNGLGGSKVLVFNYTGDRDPENLLQPFLKNQLLFDYVVFVPLDSSKERLSGDGLKNSISKKERFQINKLREIFEKNNKDSEVKVLESIDDFLKWIWGKNDDELCSVLVTGSLYLVGDFLLKLSEIKREIFKEI